MRKRVISRRLELKTSAKVRWERFLSFFEMKISPLNDARGFSSSQKFLWSQTALFDAKMKLLRVFVRKESNKIR